MNELSGIVEALKTLLSKEQLEELKNMKIKMPHKVGMKLGGVKKR
jgi:hypothetical protein